MFLKYNYQKIPSFIADVSSIIEELLTLIILLVDYCEKILMDKNLIQKSFKFKGSKYYDENNLIDLNEKTNFESIETVNQLYKDLNKLYNDSEVLKYDISFESEMDNLNKITENKNRFIDLVRLRNSIENQTEIIDNHFDKLWDGATTDISIIKNKVEIDKEFTKEYNAGVFSDKTVELINEDEHSFDNYKREYKLKDEETDNIYEQLQKNGLDTLLDDRNKSAGVKFKDADLIGAPIKVIVSPRNLENSVFEVKVLGVDEAILVNKSDLLDFIQNKHNELLREEK